eukprot:3884412-Alexandrium_andersonii.AAC.1
MHGKGPQWPAPRSPRSSRGPAAQARATRSTGQQRRRAAGLSRRPSAHPAASGWPARGRPRGG